MVKVFCLLKVHDMKTQALVIAAPFAFTLGILSSIFAIILGMSEPLNFIYYILADLCHNIFIWNAAIKEYIWSYAALEFAFFAVPLYVLYSMVRCTLAIVQLIFDNS